MDTFRVVHLRRRGRLLNLFGPGSGAGAARVFGNQVELDLDDDIQRQIYFGTFEPCETRLGRSYLRPGTTVVDVGANIGHYTSLVANPGFPAGTAHISSSLWTGRQHSPTSMPGCV